MMEHRSNVRNDVNVVQRLRLTFAIVVLILFVAALVSAFLLYKLKKSQANAIENSVPALSQSAELESNLVAISYLSARLENVFNEHQVKEIHTELIAKQAHLLHILEGDFLQTEQLEINVNELKNSTQHLEASVHGVVDAKLSMIDLQKSISTRSTLVKAIGVAFNDQIEPLSLNMANTLKESLDTNDVNTTIVQKTKTNLAENINDQHQLHEISFALTALLDMIENLPLSYDEQKHAELIADIELRFEHIEQVLAKFIQLQKRDEWATMIDGLRSLILADQGILDNIVTHQKHAAAFTTAHSEQLNQINTFSDKVNDIVFKTKENVKSTTSKFDTILSTIIMFLAFFGCGVVAIIALVNHVVVEQQINRRMQRLTSAVLDIANGDQDRDVDVSGKDEIGVMAGALEVFKDNAAELHRSNKELEQFAYAASHDLKSPLRAIESLAKWTLEDAGDDFPADAKSNLEKLLLRANRLSRLQSDLLNYSRAGQPDDNVSEVDFSRMIADLAEMLDPDHHFTVQLGRSPIGVTTQVVPLRQIILNLITNAMKHHDLDTGTIEINIDVVNNRLRISVSDDGPGIPIEYHERIFGLFEKLESHDKVEGSGLGLSLVKKMVERCRGSIAIQSAPSKQRGSTFTFDWPYIESPTVDTFEEPHKLAAGF